MFLICKDITDERGAQAYFFGDTNLLNRRGLCASVARPKFRPCSIKVVVSLTFCPRPWLLRSMRVRNQCAPHPAALLYATPVHTRMCFTGWALSLLAALTANLALRASVMQIMSAHCSLNRTAHSLLGTSHERSLAWRVSWRPDATQAANFHASGLTLITCHARPALGLHAGHRSSTA